MGRGVVTAALKGENNVSEKVDCFLSLKGAKIAGRAKRSRRGGGGG